MDLVEQIDALLPQTQCQRCTYNGCKPYAEAIAQGQAAINQCPPGGSKTIAALARLLQCPPLPLDPTFGEEPQTRTVAVIDESTCIGCTLCIQACPLDAIIGAAKLMHTVLLEDCSGCELCLPPCPVDCISMVPAAEAPGPVQADWSQAHADRARQRYAVHQQRHQQTEPRPRRLPDSDIDPRKALIDAALARVKHRKSLQATSR